MTLTSAIEAAREAMTNATGWMHMRVKTFHVEKMEKALSALPEKPLSEAAIIKYVANILELTKFDFADAQATAIVHAMKAANVLFVKED